MKVIGAATLYYLALPILFNKKHLATLGNDLREDEYLRQETKSLESCVVIRGSSFIRRIEAEGLAAKN
jgi:hypothetical protein